MIRSRKVRFIEPRGREGRPFNAWIRRWPLLGPVTLATILHERGHDVAVYNENVSGSILDNPVAYADVCSADVVGISIMTPTAARGYQIADCIKRDAPHATVAFGGVHATFCPEEALQHGDVVVRGEGENVIEALARGEIRHGIHNPAPPEDLDRLPTLNHALMYDFDKLVAWRRCRDLYELPVAASRGCPYGCTYCSVTRMFGRRIRRQSVDKVHHDLQQYMQRGFRSFFFYDDNFIADRAWSKELLGRLRRQGVRFNAQCRADFPWTDASRRTVDEPLLHAIRGAGGDVLYIGYETIDDATAHEWKKGYRGTRTLRQRLRQDTQLLHDNGLWVHAMFVVGPQHTQKTIDHIVDFARENHIETLQISILTPFPGTPLFAEMRPHLIFTDFPSDWDFYDGTHCVYNHSRLGVAGLQQSIIDAHRKFYRWAGWSLRRVQAMIRQRAPIRDKLALLWNNARIARQTMRQWCQETRSFLELVKSKELQYLSQVQPQGA
jgi:radical SAM superfamily enzyme YgiQ (UPF0313 family)